MLLGNCSRAIYHCEFQTHVYKLVFMSKQSLFSFFLFFNLFLEKAYHVLFYLQMCDCMFQVHCELRKWLPENVGAEIAASTRIINGGIFLYCLHY